MTTDDFTFYSRAEYFADVAARAENAKRGDRIALATMNFRPSDVEVHHALTALGAATKRGASVVLLVDAYNFLVGERKQLGPLFYTRNLPQKLRGDFQAKLQLLELLARQGVRYAITNMPKRAFTLPFSGRSHIKFAVTNNRIYIGGCNLSHTSQIDIMTAWDDRKTADWLYDFAEQMQASQGSSFMHGKDLEFQVDDQSRILVDAGAREQSIIYKNALQLIDAAEKELFITCQYFPGGLTAQHLLAAHRRGVRVTIFFSPPNVHGREALGHHLHNTHERLRLPREFFAGKLSKASPKLHAKVLASEKSAIIGSHNFVTQGVSFGTAEIALLRHDAGFAEQAKLAIYKQLDSLPKKSL